MGQVLPNLKVLKLSELGFRKLEDIIESPLVVGEFDDESLYLKKEPKPIAKPKAKSKAKPKPKPS